MQLTGTHHVALKTANFAAMRAFYVETLGLPYLGGFPGRNIIFIGAGSTTIELIEAEGPIEPARLGWHHMALEVADTDAAHAELAAKGVAFHVEPRSFPPDAPAVRLAFFKDPDGNELELYQPIGGKYPQQS
ncbi:MAG: VOC family protein [Roseiflexaceae bacterium]|jgi:catechol 2,3-dioxygenase-like lactoylglutathione lyase family enzyme